jgi:hypothetical protein
MKNSFKLKISITLETKTDEIYSSWKDAFTKVSDETLIIDSENATVEAMQKIIKTQMNDVLIKAQNFVENSNLLQKNEEDNFTL